MGNTNGAELAEGEVTAAMAVLAANEVLEQQEANRHLRRVNASLNADVARLRARCDYLHDSNANLLSQVQELTRIVKAVADSGGELGERAAELLKFYAGQIPF